VSVLPSRCRDSAIVTRGVSFPLFLILVPFLCVTLFAVRFEGALFPFSPRVAGTFFRVLFFFPCPPTRFYFWSAPLLRWPFFGRPFLLSALGCDPLPLLDYVVFLFFPLLRLGFSPGRVRQFFFFFSTPLTVAHPTPRLFTPTSYPDDFLRCLPRGLMSPFSDVDRCTVFEFAGGKFFPVKHSFLAAARFSK